MWFWYQCNADLIKLITKNSVLFYFLEEFVQNWYYFFLFRLSISSSVSGEPCLQILSSLPFKAQIKSLFIRGAFQTVSFLSSSSEHQRHCSTNKCLVTFVLLLCLPFLHAWALLYDCKLLEDWNCLFVSPQHLT